MKRGIASSTKIHRINLIPPPEMYHITPSEHDDKIEPQSFSNTECRAKDMVGHSHVQ